MPTHAPAAQFLGHSTVALQLGGTRVLTDPVLTPRIAGFIQRVAPAPPAADRRADLVVLSHLHADHTHLPSLRLLGTDVPLVVPWGAGEWLRGKGFTDVTEVAPGETLRRDRVRMEVVPALHDGSRGPRGPRALAVGYVLEDLDGDAGRTYVAGDTDLFPGMAEIPEVDLALLPVWGWGPNLGPGHLTPERAARAVGLLGPRYAVPVHWGTFYPQGLQRVLPDRLVDPPHVFAREVARLGLPTDVLVTSPGDAVVIP